MKLINIGFGNMVNAERVLAVVSPESSPMKRMVAAAKENGKLIDATQGRKTASILFTDSEHILLSYLKPEKLSERFRETDAGDFEEEKP